MCKDCNSEVKGYMVRNAIWSEAHSHKHNYQEVYFDHKSVELVDQAQAGELCIPCLETRIGRTLTKHDFTNCELNRRNGYK